MSPTSKRVKTLQLPDVALARHAAPTQDEGSTQDGRRPRFALTSRTSWLIPPVMLAAAILGAAIVLRGPFELYGYALGAIFIFGLIWLFISCVYPDRADSTCPECDADELERLDPTTTIGVRCKACGFVDAHVSSWMFAEHEGVPLEGIVMENRGRKLATSTSTTEPSEDLNG